MSTLKTSIVLMTVLSLSSNLALAGHERDYGRVNFEDYARVVSATPEYERVNQPTQQCSTEYQRTGYREEYQDGNNYTGTIVGGVAGALLGSRLGKGKGNRAATAAGAIAGAVIGNQIQTRNRPARCGARPVERYEPVQRCQVVDHWEDRLTGYRVVYEYGGRTHSTVLPYDPGHKLAVRVAVSPAQ